MVPFHTAILEPRDEVEEVDLDAIVAALVFGLESEPTDVLVERDLHGQPLAVLPDAIKSNLTHGRKNKLSTRLG